jgi:hypothetical protein
MVLETVKLSFRLDNHGDRDANDAWRESRAIVGFFRMRLRKLLFARPPGVPDTRGHDRLAASPASTITADLLHPGVPKFGPSRGRPVTLVLTEA